MGHKSFWKVLCNLAFGLWASEMFLCSFYIGKLSVGKRLCFVSLPGCLVFLSSLFFPLAFGSLPNFYSGALSRMYRFGGIKYRKQNFTETKILIILQIGFGVSSGFFVLSVCFCCWSLFTYKRMSDLETHMPGKIDSER